MSPHFARALRFAESSEKAGAWTLSELHRLAYEFQETHDIAIHAASSKALSWAAECGGGSGEGGEGYKNLAAVINGLSVDK